MHAPKKSHYEATLHVVRYIKGHPSLGLLMSNKRSGKINDFCDVDWEACMLSRKSIIAFSIKVGESFVSLNSKKKNTSAKAEYRSMTSTMAEFGMDTRTIAGNLS